VATCLGPRPRCCSNCKSQELRTGFGLLGIVAHFKLAGRFLRVVYSVLSSLFVKLKLGDKRFLSFRISLRSQRKWDTLRP